jgi:hypothetical protein
MENEKQIGSEVPELHVTIKRFSDKICEKIFLVFHRILMWNATKTKIEYVKKFGNKIHFVKQQWLQGYFCVYQKFSLYF